MSTCYKASDNKHHGCPPRMSDGRHFTDYRPSCDADQTIRRDNNMCGSNQYREFLQNNGVAIMNKDRKHACELNCCAPCKKEAFADTMLPAKYNVICDKNTCTRELNDINGLGDARIYFAEGECAGLPAALPQQPNNVCTSPFERMNYLGDYQSGVLMRRTTPRGGDASMGGDPCAYNM